ncbi:Serpentine Receptor, class D (Delta) [Caenorhabditis elegans]|uniref:Serpentine Receptor, class D (Delta) n=1 Tax=Caenorhabditis elegans TaxID=6239 RepID=Q21714_CAEEL|nr:Serpentine Receptor, class D (Delta) [Caenorhabditis elegans]CAA94164.1 Serpentine Receptor, class D (Delta) [Caenorhabditis elegans]|eukprot:NP_510212.1 Serpentine Receptor, class D (delta) [Caenorhabditis elegans]
MIAAEYRSLLFGIYPIFFFFTLIAQLFLLFLIVKHSPKSIHMLRIILGLTCIFQIVLAFSSFFTQIRFITTKKPIEMWSYGLCKHFEPWICYCFYQAEQLTALASGLTIYGTFFLKYRMVKGVQMSKFEILKTYFTFYCPFCLSFILVIIIVKTQTFSWEAQEQLRLVNLFLNNEDEYLVFAFLSFSKWPNTLNLIITSFCIFVVPVLSFHWRKRTLRQIYHQMENMSAPRQQLYKSFVMGLTIQCVLPYVFYIPIYTLYYYCLLTGEEILFLEFFLVLIPALPTLVDPIISIYFVTPFRRKLMRWVKKEREETRTTNAFTR